MKCLVVAIYLSFIAISVFATSVDSGSIVIAAMLSSDQPRYRDAHRAFLKAMAARGYASPSAEIILQTPNPDQLSWSNTIRKFNAYRPNLIIAYGASAALTAVKESDGIPVVSVDVYSAELPLKGMCGVSSRVPMISLLKTIRGIRPYTKIGVLYSPREIGSVRQLDEIRKHTSQFGMKLIEGSVTTTASLDSALQQVIDKSEVVLVTESAIVCRQFERVISRARARNLPVVATMPDAVEKGALVSLEVSPQEQGHLAAEMASRILEGAKVEHLSMIAPRRIDLVINMRLAKEMGIDVPFAVLGSATRIVK